MSNTNRERIVRKYRRRALIYSCGRAVLLMILVTGVFAAGHFLGGMTMKEKMEERMLPAAGNAQNPGEGLFQDGDPANNGNMGTDVNTGTGGNSGTGTNGNPGTSGSQGGSGNRPGEGGGDGSQGGMGGNSGGGTFLSGEEDISWIWMINPLLILVNKDHKLPEDYEVELMTLSDKSNHAASVAYEPLNAMLKAGRKEGLAFEVCSSYRSVKRQRELLDEDIEKLMKNGYSYQEAYDEVTMQTMPPGYSEHSTGLAFDIVALDYQMLDKKQASTDETLWLHEHCAEYGFILRYPEGREDVTGITYESWHYRYVGVEAATYIMEHNLTLEEYLGELAEKALGIISGERDEEIEG